MKTEDKPRVPVRGGTSHAEDYGKSMDIPDDAVQGDVSVRSSEMTVLAPDPSPMSMMIEAKQAGFSMSEINEMMDLQDRNDKRIAKQAFDKAMAAFKENPPEVVKDLINDQYDSGYTSIGNMVTSVTEAMGPFGLHTHWDFPEPKEAGAIAVTCILSHELGHEISVTLEGPVDSGGKKNPIQERKSTRTYLKLETFEAVTGMASKNGNLDDDGKATTQAPVELITEDQVNQLHSLITDNELDMDLQLRWLSTSPAKAGRLEDIPASMFDVVTKKIEAGIEIKLRRSKAQTADGGTT